MTPPIARSGERGFALLVVMLLAAAIAFALYTQVPRFAFESAREREQLLMDRGNQYKRAIQVFYAVNKRYPAKLEDLENTNDKRFLRRRYKDPMTGKDQWRMIHTNGSTLTDSLVQKPPAQNANGTPGNGVLPGGGPLGTNNMNSFDALAAPGQSGATGSTANPNGAPQPVAVNPAAMRRPSDRVNTPMPSAAPVQNPQDPNYTAGLYAPNYNPNDPSTWPAITLAPVNPQNGAQQNGGQQNGALPGTPFQGGQNGQPLGIPGFGGQNAQPVTQISAQPFGQQNPFDPQASLQNPNLGGQTLGGQPAGGQTVGGLPFGGQPVTPLPFGPQGNLNGDGSNSLVQPNPVPAQAPSGIPGQGPGQGGFNPQPTQIFNPGSGFAGNPLAPDPTAQPGIQPAPFGNQPAPGNAGGVGSPAQLNPALQAINNQLSSPTTQMPVPAPANGPNGQNGQTPQAATGIAGVASTFEGTSIKIYNKRTKYKEWEFVFDPSTATTPGQPANGQNPAGQPGQPGQQGQTGAGGAFSLGTNPFAPNQSGQPNQTGQPPNNAAPAPSPFGQTPNSSGSSPNPFGQQPNPFGSPTQ